MAAAGGSFAGGQLFGFLGMLLALPVAAVANVLLRYAHERYLHSRLYEGDKPEIEIAGAAASQRPVIIVTDSKDPDGER